MTTPEREPTPPRVVYDSSDAPLFISEGPDDTTPPGQEPRPPEPSDKPPEPPA
jgi:hypothetical protein